MSKIAVGVLGATGMVGQQYVQLLAHHPWFELTFLAGSHASKTYGEAVCGRWHSATPLPEHIAKMAVHAPEDIVRAKSACRALFSAMSTEGAKVYEAQYAEAGLAVISNAAYHRSFSDVPLLIPEINPDHTSIIPAQQKRRGWQSGFIVVKPNCSIQSYMIPLFPLHSQFKLKSLIITTLQAISGAGHPGIASLDIADNIIPHIEGEEEKSESEPLKILGEICDGHIKPLQGVAISTHCNRVPVTDGHLACVSMQFETKPQREEIIALWEGFGGVADLPSAPVKPMIYHEESNRPQTRLDRLAGKGMAISVGRLRPCSVFDYRFVALSHNTIRGAAGGGVLNGELLIKQGYLR